MTNAMHPTTIELEAFRGSALRLQQAERLVLQAQKALQESKATTEQVLRDIFMAHNVPYPESPINIAISEKNGRPTLEWAEVKPEPAPARNVLELPKAKAPAEEIPVSTEV